jgi:hypothetical protein
MPSCDDICVVCCRTRSHPFLCISSFFSFSISSCSPTHVNWSGEEQAVLMKANDEVDHHLRPVGAATDWRRSRSESSGAVDDLETSYVPAAACLPGPHRRHYVNISNHFVFLFFSFLFLFPTFTCQHPVSFSITYLLRLFTVFLSISCVIQTRFLYFPLFCRTFPFDIRPHLPFFLQWYFLFIF